MRNIASRTMLLTALVMGLVAAPSDARAQSQQDMAECTAYNFDADSLSRLVATDKEIDAAMQNDADIKKALDTTDMSKHSLAEITDAVAAVPKLVEIIDSHGFKPHDFVVANSEFILSAFAAAMLKDSSPDEREKNLSSPQVNRANVELIEKTPEAMDYLKQKMGG
jgi:hypothetical protein